MPPDQMVIRGLLMSVRIDAVHSEARSTLDIIREYPAVKLTGRDKDLR